MLNNRVIKHIREQRAKLRLIRLFLIEAIGFFIHHIKHNASTNTTYSKQKMEYTLLRETHVIEKGMSMRAPRKGFGFQKVDNLIERLTIYHVRYKDRDFLRHPIGVVNSYLDFTSLNGTDVSSLKSKLARLSGIAKLESSSFENNGTKIVTKQSIHEKSLIDFDAFLKSRHSIRYFSSEAPSIELIKNALEMAQKTPSACNRQSWKAYVVSGEKNKELLRWQGGANGFEAEIPTSLLITTSTNAFLEYETFQGYVDGGLYAMTVVYALHSLGLGTIPLSTGFHSKKNSIMKEKFGINDDEIPIMIIGVGCLLDEFKVAVSSRKSANSCTFFLGDN